MKISDKELELFKKLGVDNYIPCMDVVTIYKVAAERCFVENRQGKEVDSLRKCVKAIRDCNVYRNTKEWDALIDL